MYLPDREGNGANHRRVHEEPAQSDPVASLLIGNRIA